MKVEVETLFDSCAECYKLDVTEGDMGFECSHKDVCRLASLMTLRELEYKFGNMEHEAYKKDVGLKEHATWNKAIRILEEYME